MATIDDPLAQALGEEPAAVTTSPALIDRVAAQSLHLRPLKVLLTLLALPFYALGWVVGFAWLAIVFAFGALKVGFVESRARFDRRPQREVT